LTISDVKIGAIVSLRSHPDCRMTVETVSVNTGTLGCVWLDKRGKVQHREFPTGCLLHWRHKLDSADAP
jgi:hypothetical protein